MKKTKRLSALLLASLISAGTVSSLSAGANADSFYYYTHIDGKDSRKDFEEALENCAFKIPVENEILGGCYVLNIDNPKAALYGTPGYYKIIRMDDAISDDIQIWADPDIDVEKIRQSVYELYPDAEISSYLIDFGAPEVFGGEHIPDIWRGVTIKAFKDKLPYHEAKEKNITLENAEKLHDIIAQNGGVRSFLFRENPIKASVTYTTLTCYGPFEENETYDEFEKYISENNMNCHLYYNNYFKSIDFLSYDNLSAEDYYKIAEKIYRDINTKPYISWSKSGNQSDEITFDLHNYISGDANDDDQLALSDAVAILQSIGNPDDYELTPQGEYNADITGDKDGITNLDALTVQRKLLKLE